MTSGIRTHGSRTAAYLVAWLIATLPALFVVAFVANLIPGVDPPVPLEVAGGVVVGLWVAGVAWLVRMRRADKFWDRSLPPESR